jgi:hypothetical protein
MLNLEKSESEEQYENRKTISGSSRTVKSEESSRQRKQRRIMETDHECSKKHH